jgi:hypothetical protein
MQGVDYIWTLSPIVKLNSINVLITLTIQYNIKMHQLDVKTMFLNGYLDENIVIWITKCIDTTKKLYPYIFEKSQGKQKIGIVMFFLGISSITCKISMWKIWFKFMIFQESFCMISKFKKIVWTNVSILLEFFSLINVHQSV